MRGCCVISSESSCQTFAKTHALTLHRRGSLSPRRSAVVRLSTCRPHFLMAIVQVNAVRQIGRCRRRCRPASVACIFRSYRSIRRCERLVDPRRRDLCWPRSAAMGHGCSWAQASTRSTEWRSAARERLCHWGPARPHSDRKVRRLLLPRARRRWGCAPRRGTTRGLSVRTEPPRNKPSRQPAHSHAYCPDGGWDARRCGWFVASRVPAGGLENALPPCWLAS